MKLIDFVKIITDVDDELIIFQENKEDFNSDIILSYGKDGDNGIKINGNKKYYYLIEVFLAKEFVQDWIQSLDFIPNEGQIAKRLFKYALNDA